MRMRMRMRTRMRMYVRRALLQVASDARLRILWSGDYQNFLQYLQGP